MGRKPAQTLTLVEYEPLRLPRAALDLATGETIWRRYRQQVAVEFPSVKTGDSWQLTALGWVGVLPVSPMLTMVLQPKVALRTLWSLLGYAFDLTDVLVGGDLIRVAALPDLYDGLARLLAQHILTRCRQGLVQAYRPKVARVAAIRGRIALAPTLRTPWQPQPVCRFEEQTLNVEDNQILLWTLYRLLQGAICQDETHTLVRQGYAALRGSVSLRPFWPADLRQRQYTRLNADYQLMHALCYFFLAQSAPALNLGELPMQPFCLHMASLFERVVAAWLARHLDGQWRLKQQERHRFGSHDELSFAIDLVIRQRGSERARTVIDTKYKLPTGSPAADDIAQVVAYAETTGAQEAILVYPAPLARPFVARLGRVQVRSLSFALDRPVDQAGAEFLQALRLP